MLTILEPVGDQLRVLLAGEIDHHSSCELRDRIDQAIERHRPQLLVLDFGGVTFMDSSGIGLIMGRYKLISSYGGRIEVANLPKNLRRVMRLAGIGQLATIDNGGDQHETV